MASGTAASTGEELKDGLQLFIDDHEKYRNLFAKFWGCSDRKVKTKIVQMLIKELSGHAAAEERYLIPLASSRLPRQVKAIVDRMNIDHQNSKQLLHWLETYEPTDESSDEEWGLYLDTAAKYVRSEDMHLKEEEKYMIHPLRGVVESERLADLFDKIALAKCCGPTHPHPEGPTASLLKHVVHPLTGLVDRTLDSFLSRDQTDT